MLWSSERNIARCVVAAANGHPHWHFFQIATWIGAMLECVLHLHNIYLKIRICMRMCLYSARVPNAGLCILPLAHHNHHHYYYGVRLKHGRVHCGTYVMLHHMQLLFLTYFRHGSYSRPHRWWWWRQGPHNVLHALHHVRNSIDELWIIMNSLSRTSTFRYKFMFVDNAHTQPFADTRLHNEKCE